MDQTTEACRICGGHALAQVLDLGRQMLTGVFPSSRDQQVTVGPLELVKCTTEGGCGLVQLGQSYDLGEMYGDNYGYRSGLNASMVKHLGNKVSRIVSMVTLETGDLVVDIGSNDGTTLRAYPDNVTLVGVDPTGNKFREYYPDHIKLIPDFFSAELVLAAFADRKAKVITSFSMFYDLPSPMQFMKDVCSLLDDEGIWVCEQSYLPLMLDTNSYDTVCHEHLEFYGLTQIHWMAERVGLSIIDVEFNDVNGGSFSFTARKTRPNESINPDVKGILAEERARGLNSLVPFEAFAGRVAKSRADLRAFIDDVKSRGETVAAIGASTKGNVLLQYCGLTDQEIFAVGEVNPDKFGHFTPGSWLPIIAEDELLSRRPDYLLVLPWHFREFFESSPKFKDVNLVFPLPELRVSTPKSRLN